MAIAAVTAILATRTNGRSRAESVSEDGHTPDDPSLRFLLPLLREALYATRGTRGLDNWKANNMYWTHADRALRLLIP